MYTCTCFVSGICLFEILQIFEKKAMYRDESFCRKRWQNLCIKYLGIKHLSYSLHTRRNSIYCKFCVPDFILTSLLRTVFGPETYNLHDRSICLYTDTDHSECMGFVNPADNLTCFFNEFNTHTFNCLLLFARQESVNYLHSSCQFCKCFMPGLHWVSP